MYIRLRLCAFRLCVIASLRLCVIVSKNPLVLCPLSLAFFVRSALRRAFRCIFARKAFPRFRVLFPNPVFRFRLRFPYPLAKDAATIPNAPAGESGF